MSSKSQHAHALVGIMTLVTWLSGCSVFTNEGYRTSRAYDMGNRGTETYTVAPGTDSIKAAESVNQTLTEDHIERTKIMICSMIAGHPTLTPLFCPNEEKFEMALHKPNEDGAFPIGDQKTGTEKSGNPDSSGKASGTHIPTTGISKQPRKSGEVLTIMPMMMPLNKYSNYQLGLGYPLSPTRVPNIDVATNPFPPTGTMGSAPPLAPKIGKGSDSDNKASGHADASEINLIPGPPPSAEYTLYDYSLSKFWPENYFVSLMNATTGKSDAETLGLVREFNNLLWQQFLRDLLTEPSAHSMVPTSRTVVLGCAPPPEQTVITTATSLLAEVTGKGGVKGSLDARLAESAIKLFEQSERTIFLQYAMFRLCEMSVNSPGEFRNVFPLVIQDLVRQSAALTTETEVEKVRTQRVQAETLGKLAALEQDRLKCVKGQMDKNKDSKPEEVAKYCGSPYQPPLPVSKPVSPEPASNTGT